MEAVPFHGELVAFDVVRLAGILIPDRLSYPRQRQQLINLNTAGHSVMSPPAEGVVTRSWS